MTATDPALSTTLPADPFTALAVHFGMLLGVTDFETLAANPRGKLRLHNAWLHAEGVVWGFDVTLDQPKIRQLSVGPGLALDAVGHELYLGVTSCLDLGDWYDTASKDPASGLPKPAPDGAVTFDAHLVARYRACLAQPVPAMASPCGGTATDTAFSRVNETIELRLIPGKAPDRSVPFAKLRALLGLPAPGLSDDARKEAEAARARIAAMIPGERAQGWLDEFRTLAAEEVTALRPPGQMAGHAGSTPLFPADEPVDLLLAQLTGVKLSPGPDGTRVASVGRIDMSVRWSHVPTTTIAELVTAATGNGGGFVGADAGGPRIDPSSAAWSGDTINVTVQGNLLPGTLDGGITVESLNTENQMNRWINLAFSATFNRGTSTLSVRLASPPQSGHWVRVLVSGSGVSPVMGPPPTAGGSPVALAGPLDGPPAAAAQGYDVAILIQRS